MVKDVTYGRDQLVGIINSVLGKMNTPSDAAFNQLSSELAELKTSIESLGSQLHMSSANDINETHIPDATDELFAVVEATEQATETIMESCEKIIENLKGVDPETFETIEKYIVAIFEACTFQDITGQRIKKVTGCLKEIDTKTASVLALLHNGKTHETGDKTGKEEVSSLLNGPGLPQNAMSQDDIDKLLEDFDSGDV